MYHDAVTELYPNVTAIIDGVPYDSDGNKVIIDHESVQALLDVKLVQQQKDKIRRIRNNLLSDTDWVVVKHNELGTPIPQEWLDYRQALRDITEQSGFPDNVEWPTAPSNHEETN